jgi:sterol desaturase/sphingolipid hydroxylase (fatty acid hydroxylase superfamily)
VEAWVVERRAGRHLGPLISFVASRTVDAKYIAVAIPFFFLLIGVELLVGRLRGQRDYRLYDAITSLSCGVGQQVIGVFLALATVGAYEWVRRHFGLLAIDPKSPAAWVAILFLLDLCYYAVHRASHRINAIWATHAVHHQSEDYHLATALRQSWFFGVFTALFYLPLALIGFPASMFVAMVTINTLYQFWIHTRTIGRLGPLEWVLNTPSHHRVHHGIDPKYIDKNYAGMFIIYDRMFGTFAPEEEEPVYGTVKPFQSFNSWQANLDEWQRIARLSRSCPRLRDKLYAWIAPPEWRPREQGGAVTIPEVDRQRYRKFDVPRSRALDAYLLVSFVVVAALLSAGLLLSKDTPRSVLAIGGGSILVALLAWGGFVDRRPWALPVELARLAATLAATVVIFWSSLRFTAVVATACAVASIVGALAVQAERSRTRRLP